MGGYDLYKCEWDDAAGAWGPPENMGFPFSSPADDFMLAEDTKGKYTIFASNRECSIDSVYVYAVIYDPVPELRTITDPRELQTMSLLVPSDENGHVDNVNIGSIVEEYNSGAAYMEAYARKEQLETSIKKLDREIGELETRLQKMEEGAERETVAKALEDKKAERTLAQKNLDEISSDFGNLEDMLSRSESLNTGRVSEAADTEIVGAGKYALNKHRMGTSLKIKVLPWVQNPKTKFKISPVGHFGVAGTLPEGMYYQIFVRESRTHSSAESFNGLNPVYERQKRTLQYQYYAGVFMCYQDALRALNLVRKQGFPDARIEAYNGASPISLEEALQIEASIEETTLLWQ